MQPKTLITFQSPSLFVAIILDLPGITFIEKGAELRPLMYGKYVAKQVLLDFKDGSNGG